MWILTVGIDKYFLTPEEKEFYIEAKNKGAEHVQLRDSMILSTKFISLVESTEGNEIAQDKHFIEYTGLKSKSDDLSVRRKMALEKILHLKFPYDKYTDQWEEARTITGSIVRA